ncbi:MAG: nickel-dependent hydrogenase large subunit [Bradyrhizobium sp.]|uniref:nickel-dependent hydrogenase large subunit n=1 Tax=Bradyrhizobium sp. TaxID=376 RepID=UPI0025B8EAD2|nr:nickel-dependent hydrogenase large subunit [Bradyrhizobium sp.]MBI5260241.1 nickel-dependent hydrogenase large subunit [Bradyrhizobium sp.]
MSRTTPNGFVLEETSRRVAIDPITRIEGHLRIELNVDDKNVIRNAVSVGAMWRGLEVILQGRDPRDAWAFVQRICGVCTGVHAIASVRSVEDALGIELPQNANLIRNIMMLTLYAQDHLVHFYHLHALDWVDVLSALRASPVETAALAQSISSWSKSSAGYFKDVQTKLTNFVGSGQLGPFRNGYWGHAAYKLPPEANLMAVAHYLEALDFQREIVKIHAILGGKNPHPHWLVGGVPCAINVHGTGAVGALNIERLNMVREIANRTREFIDQVYIPDLLAIASFYKDWAAIGGGLSSKNLMSYGEFPSHANNSSNDNLGMPRGAILGGDLSRLHEVDLKDPAQVQEFASHAWYKYPSGNEGLHPWDGVTECDFRLGSKGKIEQDRLINVDESEKYSYVKAPRYKGEAMEVGPLARLVIAYVAGRKDIKELVDGALRKLDVPLTALFSTLGRTAARGLEAQWAAARLVETVDDLFANIRNGDINTANTEKWEPKTWPTLAKGVGSCEAPRGALGHWIVIRDQKIANYQCVVPSTWNASSRDPKGNIGAYEAALLGTPMVDPERPLEVLRTIHSFDPCLACATHLYGPDGAPLASVDVL